MAEKVGTIFLNEPGPEAEAYARGLLGEVAERFEFVQIAERPTALSKPLDEADGPDPGNNSAR